MQSRGVRATATKHAGPRADWRSLAKFFLAGAVVTSVLLGAALLFSRRGESGDDGATLHSATRQAVAHRTADEVSAIESAETPDDRSLQDLIAEIRRLHAGPAHALTTLRLRALLESIPISQIPDLILLVNEELDAKECAAVYERLLKVWAGVDPNAALDFVLSEKIGGIVNPVNGTNLLNNLFQDWARKDRSEAGAWLLDSWDHEVLKEDAFFGSLDHFLALNLTDELLRNEGVSAAFGFVAQLPGEEDKHEVLTGLLGESPWHEGTVIHLPPAQRMELIRALRKSAEPGRQTEVMHLLWRQLGEHDPDWVQEVGPGLDPAGRFELELGWLGVTARWGESVPRENGGFTRSNLGVHDREARAAAALEAGLAAGLSRSETLEAMAGVYLAHLQDESLAWIGEHRTEFDADPILVRQAREAVDASAYYGDELPPMVAIQWASLISDEALRAQLCRGAYLRLIQRDSAAARAYLERPEAPQDLLPQFQAILSEAP